MVSRRPRRLVFDAAAARQLTVSVQLIGDPGTPPPPVVHAVLATVDAVLSVLPPQQAVLTVLAAGDDMELYLTFGSPPRNVPDLTQFGRDVPAAARWRASVSVTETDGGFLELTWRKGSAV